MYHVKMNDLTKHLMHYRLLRGGVHLPRTYTVVSGTPNLSCKAVNFSKQDSVELPNVWFWNPRFCYVESIVM